MIPISMPIRAVQAGERVADADADSRRRPIRIAGQVTHTADCLGDTAETRPIAIWPGLAVAGDAHHDELRIPGPQGVRSQAPGFELSGAVVLDDAVDALREPAHQVGPSGVRMSIVTDFLLRPSVRHIIDVSPRGNRHRRT